MIPHEVEHELLQLLRPAGGGVHLVSTGRAEQLELQRQIYQVSRDEDVPVAHRAALATLEQARGFVLGVPSDVGAGFRRGANLGPAELRRTLSAEDQAWMREHGVVDVGDVFVVPQLLHDDMLSQAQLQASRAALYPELDEHLRAQLPVSPLSMTERALDLLLSINPRLKPFVIGGDHSCAWPVTVALHRRDPNFCILQLDAHTDLLAERLGIPYCFATWSYHANQLLGGGGRLVQIGIRATRHDRGHWERSLGVRQFWADECNLDPARALTAIVAHLRAVGCQRLYLSNDIDGTDERWASATGTPEAGGLSPDFVGTLIEELGRHFEIIAGDLMELAPSVAAPPGGREVTLQTAADYFTATMRAALR